MRRAVLLPSCRFLSIPILRAVTSQKKRGPIPHGLYVAAQETHGKRARERARGFSNLLADLHARASWKAGGRPPAGRWCCSIKYCTRAMQPAAAARGTRQAISLSRAVRACRPRSYTHNFLFSVILSTRFFNFLNRVRHHIFNLCVCARYIYSSIDPSYPI